MSTTAVLHWASANSPGSYIGAAVAGLVVLLLVRAGIRTLRRHDLADTLTVLIAMATTVYAGSGNWKFLATAMHYGTDLCVVLVCALEGAVVVEGLRSRKNIVVTGKAGADGVGLWVLAGLSSLLASSASGSLQESLGRLAVPLVAAWLWERLLAPQRRERENLRPPAQIKWRITPERILVWLRLADATDMDVSSVDAGRRVSRYLRATDRAARKWRRPWSPEARADRARMRLTQHALMHGDPTAVHEQLADSAFADALRRLGIGPERAVEVPSDGESPAESDGESHAPDATSGVSQDRGLILPGDSVFQQVEANLPPALVHPVNGRQKVAAASAPARRQATITARIGGTDRDEVARLWKASQAAGSPLSTRALAKRAGVSQTTATRVIAELQDARD
jgi:hypothetical protein